MSKAPLTIEMLKYENNIRGDVEFFYKDKKYSIIFCMSPILIGEQYNEDDEQFFDDLDSLLHNYKIDGVALIDLLPDTDLDWRS